jgi:hypothetical protein
VSRDGVRVALTTIDASGQGIDQIHVDHETKQARCNVNGQVMSCIALYASTEDEVKFANLLTMGQFFVPRNSALL